MLDHFKYRHYYEIFIRDLIVMLRKNYFTEFQSVFLFVDAPFQLPSDNEVKRLMISV